jgi:hypothetical protein
MPTLSSHEVEVVLSKLCIDLGFCLPPSDRHHIGESPPSTVPEFVAAVFRAEGLDPETADRHLLRQVRDVVQGAFDRHEERGEAARRLTSR